MRRSIPILLSLLALVTAGCVADQGFDTTLDASTVQVAPSGPGPVGPASPEPVVPAGADAAPALPTSGPVLPTPLGDWPQKGRLAGNVGATAARIPDSPVIEWHVQLPGDAAYTAPVVGNGRIYFLLYGAGVAALDLATGNLLWQSQQVWGGKNRALTYAEGRLYVPTENLSSTGSKDSSAGTIVALDAATGELLWRGTQAATAIRELGGDIYFFDAGGQVHCSDGATGAERWSAALGCAAGLALDGEAGFCLSSELIGFDRHSGGKLFAVARGSGFNFSELAVADGRVYYQSDEMLYARSAKDGSVLWSVAVEFSPVTNGTIDTTPAVLGERIFVATESRLRSFTTAGNLLWSVPAPAGRNPGSVEVASNRVLLGGSAMYDADSGIALWTAPAGMPVLDIPPIIDGHFYTHEGSSVYAWGGPL
jgi:outer membrane protein assembly factor BamB